MSNKAAAAVFRILSVDLGTKNFSFCYLDGTTETILQWKRLSITSKRAGMLLIPRLASFLDGFAKEHKEMVEEATHVVIEQQMTSSMRIMEAVMYMQYLGKSQSLNARKVKAYWRNEYPDCIHVPKVRAKDVGATAPIAALPSSRSREYRLGKKLATNIVEQKFLPFQEEKWRQLYDSCDKKDDLADSLLQAVYAARLVRKKS